MQYASFCVTENLFSPWEEEMIRRGIIQSVMPMTFLRKQECVECAFLLEGTETLAEYINKNRARWENQGEVLLRFAEQAIRGLIEAESHFMSLGLFSLENDNILIRTAEEQILLLPIERREGNLSRIRAELAVFLDKNGETLSDVAWKSYRRRLLYELQEGEGGLLEIMGILINARKELYVLENESRKEK